MLKNNFYKGEYVQSVYGQFTKVYDKMENSNTMQEDNNLKIVECNLNAKPGEMS